MGHGSSQDDKRVMSGGDAVIRVNIPRRLPHDHDIVVGNGAIAGLPKRLHELGLPNAALIISGKTIFKLHGAKLVDVLSRQGFKEIEVALFVDKERNKTLKTFQTLCGKVADLEQRVRAKAIIMNLGGGVVMDVGAFVAACYDRGRAYVQLPTTLLGNVDCGIGGKCGVNYRGKNLIGAFHQPQLVLSDVSFLETLPPREMRSGLAEVIKYGIILDKKLFDSLDDAIPLIIGRDFSVLERISVRCLQIKADIVKRDEKDTKGIRAKLNFGHTIGHALEAATDYRRYTHGEAIAIGMVCACDMGERLRISPPGITKEAERLCRLAGLPISIADKGVKVDTVMTFMKHDKKFVGVRNRFILPQGKIGNGIVQDNIDEGLIKDVIAKRIAIG